jgi:hypothetical protein
MHCGDCETVCELDHAEPVCVSGRCQIDECNSPYDDCDNKVETGCETNLRTSVENCGACGEECSAENGTPSCENRVCTIECDDGFFDCDEDPATGCEQNLLGDVENCGECNEVCPFDEGETPFCLEGVCGATVCPDDFGNCDGKGDTCEADFTTDAANCGRCGGACSVFKGTPVCEDKKCGIDDCDEGWANCNAGDPDGGYANGCETNTNTDSANCGRCGTSCPTDRACVDGACECTSGLTQCGSTCVNTANNNTHCGACNSACTGGRACVNSVCQCPAGQTFCGGVCIDAQNDELNCGVCGRACETPTGTTGNTCTAGTCVPACAPLRQSCDLEPWDGCEENLASNNANCGACGRVCQFGSSAHVSPATQAGNSCSASGVCEPNCAQGFLDCDEEPWDGCEADITTVTRCGNCLRDCAGTACGSGGDTSCCVAVGSGYQCQSQIVLANHSMDVNAAGSAAQSITLSHTPQSGSNRMVLVVVAAEAEGQGQAGAQPSSVTYGGTGMTAGPLMTAGTAYWGADLFTYYVLESVVATKSGAQNVVVNGGASPNPTMIAADVIQFNGVSQSNPLAVFGTDIELEPTPDPTILSAALAVPAGGRIYALTGAIFVDPSAQPVATVSPSAQTMLMTTLASPTVGSLRAFGTFISGTLGASSLSAGTYTATWTWPYTGHASFLALVIPPAQQ